jgi:hypothetical protein
LPSNCRLFAGPSVYAANTRLNSDSLPRPYAIPGTRCKSSTWHYTLTSNAVTSSALHMAFGVTWNQMSRAQHSSVCSRGPGFTSPLGDWPVSPITSFLLVPSDKMTRDSLKFGHDRFRPHNLQIIIY